jgi:hypothetical protein
VGCQQQFSLARAIGQCKGGRHAERIERVNVAPGRQHVGRADQVAAGNRGDEVSAQRVEQGWQFVRLGKQLVDPRPRFGIGFGHDANLLGACFGVNRAADHVQAVRDQRIFGFEQASATACLDCALQCPPPAAWERISSASSSRWDAPGSSARQRVRLSFSSASPL